MSAPIGGTIIQRRVGLGQYINVGANDPVFTVGNLSTVWLIANVRESDAPKMKVGAAVEVTVLAFPGRVFNARLAYVAPALDPNTRRLPVRAEIQNTGRELLPEMFASFRIVSGDDRLMPAVPSTPSSTKAPRRASGSPVPTARRWCRATDRRSATRSTAWSRCARASRSARPW